MLRSIGLGLAMAVLATPAPARQLAPVVASQRDIVYRTADSGPRHLDLHRPQGAKDRRAPVLVVIHGGAWARGERPKGWTGYRRFVDAGFAVVSKVAPEVQDRLMADAVAFVKRHRVID